MKKVLFFKHEVKKLSHMDDYTDKDFYGVAIAQINRNNIDAFDHEEIMTDEEALKIEGTVWTERGYIGYVDVNWAYIDEYYDEEE